MIPASDRIATATTGLTYCYLPRYLHSNTGMANATRNIFKGCGAETLRLGCSWAALKRAGFLNLVFPSRLCLANLVVSFLTLLNLEFGPTDRPSKKLPSLHPHSRLCQVPMGCGGSRPEVIEGEDATGEPHPKLPEPRSKPLVPARIPFVPDGVSPASSFPAATVAVSDLRSRRADDRVNSDKRPKDLVSPSHHSLFHTSVSITTYRAQIHHSML